MTKDDPVGSPKSGQTAAVVECVGSLLIPSSELQELSDHHPSPTSPESKEREMVGSILLPPSEFLSQSMETKDNEEPKERFMTRLQKRITKELQKPPPEDAPDFWFY